MTPYEALKSGIPRRYDIRMSVGMEHAIRADVPAPLGGGVIVNMAAFFARPVGKGRVSVDLIAFLVRLGAHGTCDR